MDAQGPRSGSRSRRAALEGYLVLLADHGMNASTFALRIAISTQSDLVSAATAALAALKGPIHGGAPSRVSDMLDAIGTPDRAERWIARAARRGARCSTGSGTGRTRPTTRERVALHRIARDVADPARLELAEAVERHGARGAPRTAKPRARLFTNVEFYSAVVLEAVGLPARAVHADVRRRADGGLDGPRARAGLGQPVDPARRSSTWARPRDAQWPRPLADR